MKWAQNPAKLQRAIQKLPKDASELELLAEYRRIGGLVIESEVPNEEENKPTKAKIGATTTPVTPATVAPSTTTSSVFK